MTKKSKDIVFTTALRTAIGRYKGIWNKYLHNSIPHTYNSRTCWSLLELYSLVADEKYKVTAINNLDWVLQQQNSNGWFKNANFKPNELPNTHGISYTLHTN